MEFMQARARKLAAGFERLENDDQSEFIDSCDPLGVSCESKSALISRIFAGLPKSTLAYVLIYSIEFMSESVHIGKILTKTTHSFIYEAVINNRPAIAKLCIYANITDPYINDLGSAVSEAASMARLSPCSPFLYEVIRFYGLYADLQNNVYIIMDRANTTVADVMRESKLLKFSMQYIARDILVGLAMIHKKGLIHRDIHIGNIFLNIEHNDKFRAVIGDFGHATSASPRMTENIGAYGSKAPEILIATRKSPHPILSKTNWYKKCEIMQYTTKVDSWAAGCVLLFIAYSEIMPDDLDKILILIERFKITNCSGKFKELVLGLLHIDPEQRWSATRALSCEYIFEVF